MIWTEEFIPFKQTFEFDDCPFFEILFYWWVLFSHICDLELRLILTNPIQLHLPCPIPFVRISTGISRGFSVCIRTNSLRWLNLFRYIFKNLGKCKCLQTILNTLFRSTNVIILNITLLNNYFWSHWESLWFKVYGRMLNLRWTLWAY